MANKKEEVQVQVERQAPAPKIETKQESKATPTPKQSTYLIAFCSQSNIIQRTKVEANSIKEAIAKFSALGYDKDMIFAVTNLGE